MRGCIVKAKTKRGLKPGESAWRLILSLGRGSDGKPKQKWITFRGTRKQAEQKLVELVGETHRGEFVEPSKVTVAEWLDQWLEKAVKPPMCAQSTYDTYEGIIRNHLKPAFAGVLLQRLSPLQVERHYAEVGQKLQPSSVRVQHVILLQMLDAAVNASLLRVNVAQRAMNKPQMQLSEDVLNNVWNASEARSFLSAAKRAASLQWTTFFALAIDSGARKGELLGLQWKDLDGKLLRVDRQLLVKGKQQNRTPETMFALPKGKRARSFELGDETLALLADHKKQQAEFKLRNRPNYRDHGLIFAQAWEHASSRHSVLGMPVPVDAVHRELKAYIEAAGVKRITMHGLRHTCATLLLAAGVPPHVVQRRLGHKKVEITLNLYAHVLPSMQADAAARLAALLHG